MAQTLLYDPAKTYDENFDRGPFAGNTNFTSYVDETPPDYTFLGFKVNLPFGIPAGPLLNSKFIKAAFDLGFDVVHYKTQRSVKFHVNAFPNVVFVDVDGDLTLEKAQKPLLGRNTTSKKITEISITNSFGNPSRGPEFWQEDMKKALTFEKPGQILVASVVGTIQKGFSEEDYYNDFAYAAHLAKETE